MVTYFFQGIKQVLDETILMKRTTPLFCKELVLSQRTGMNGTATAADDKEVLTIFRSMKIAVSHFLGDKKYLSA